MSGKRGMKQYPESTKEMVRDEIKSGKSQIQISREYGISRYSIQSWCGLRPEIEIRQVAPLRRGRRASEEAKTIDDYRAENKRLKMENELMRDFLSLTERK